MDPKRVTTAATFAGFVGALSAAAPGDRSLEEYLRALWILVREHASATPSFPLFARLLAESLTSAPAPFDERWLETTEPPDLPPGLNAARPIDARRDWATAEAMLRFQIADLRRLAEAGTLADPVRGFGVGSPTGNRWYNFEPEGFLECAAAGYREQRSAAAVDATWMDLAVLLELGQIYE